MLLRSCPYLTFLFYSNALYTLLSNINYKLTLYLNDGSYIIDIINILSEDFMDTKDFILLKTLYEEKILLIRQNVLFMTQPALSERIKTS